MHQFIRCTGYVLRRTQPRVSPGTSEDEGIVGTKTTPSGRNLTYFNPYVVNMVSCAPPWQAVDPPLRTGQTSQEKDVRLPHGPHILSCFRSSNVVECSVGSDHLTSGDHMKK